MLRNNNKYEQSGGQNSVNLQGENVHYHGLTYSDAKEIAQDVFEKNFRELTTEAAETAAQRANEVREQIMNKLKQVEENVLESFKDPDVQYQIFNVQKEYARSGDENLAEMLTDLLVERVNEPDRTLKQVLLNESMSVLPKLIKGQVDILTWVFVVRYVKDNSATSLKMFQGFFNAVYNGIPLDEQEIQLSANYKHLQYAGCGATTIGESFEKLHLDRYPNLFSKETDVIDIMRDLCPRMETIAKIWNDTELRHFTLTSVGMTIAHANLCRLIGIKTDLEVWISS